MRGRHSSFDILGGDIQQNLLHQRQKDDIDRKLSFEKHAEIYKKFNFLSEEPLTKNNAIPRALSLLRQTIPNVFTQLSTAFFQFANLFFIQTTNDALIIGAYGLAATWFNSACYSALTSLNTGLFTQVSQVYGAKNYKLIGKLFNKAFAISLVTAFLGSILLLNTKRIMFGLGIKEESADLALEFVTWMLPSLFFISASDCLKNVLLGIQKPDLVMNSYLVSQVTHPVWLSIFFMYFDMPILGMSIARNLSELMILLNLLYRAKQEQKRNPFINEMIQPFFQIETFQGWWEYLKVAIPVGSVVYLEWVFFEVMTLVAGVLQDDNQLAGHTSFQQILLFFYMVPLGLAMSVNSYLGNCVGDGKKQIAINFSKVAFCSCLIQILIMMVVGCVLHPVFRMFLVGNEEIGEYFDFIYFFYGLKVIIPDYMQCVFGAILRSAGLEQQAMWIFVTGYYLIGVPITLFLVFGLNLGIHGVWYALFSVCAIGTIMFVIAIKRMDWDTCIESVRVRVALEKGEAEEEYYHHDTKYQSPVREFPLVDIRD